MSKPICLGGVPILPKINLIGVSLDANHLTGTISHQISSTILSSVVVSSNHFTGSIPSNWCIPSLRQVLSSYNQLESTIPPCYSVSVYLFMDHNYLTGPIPSSLLVSPSMRHLILNGNDLGSTIPSSILQGLVWVDISSNRITGTLPRWGVPNRSLHKVYVSSNHISGTIPTDWVGMTHIDVGSNGIHGTLPSGLWSTSSLKSLVYLSVYANALHSTIRVLDTNTGRIYIYY